MCDDSNASLGSSIVSDILRSLPVTTRIDCTSNLTDIDTPMEKIPMEKIPMEKKSLLDLTKQIFCKNGSLRDILIDYMNKNINDTLREKSYIIKQITFVVDAYKQQRESMFFRVLTHAAPFIKVYVQLFCTYDKVKNVRELKFCVVGDDLRESFNYLPKAIYPDGSIGNPRTGTLHSRWYDYGKNTNALVRIATELRMMQLYISNSGEKVKDRAIVSSEENKNASGTLDLDLAVDYSTLIKYDKNHGTDLMSLVKSFYLNRGNPVRIRPGCYMYNKNGTEINVLNTVVETFGKQFESLYPKHIYMSHDRSNKDVFIDDMKSLITGTSTVAIVSINHHSMLFVKSDCDGKMWYLLDPWKKYPFQIGDHDYIVEILDTIFASVGLSRWVFLPRAYEEQYKREGSCSLAILSRVVQICVNEGNHVNEHIETPITDWAAMLASCIVRKIQSTR